MKTILLHKEPVELFKILKFEGIVDSGGRAKSVIAAGEVKLNDNVELQKRKKVVAGDIIEYQGEKFVMALAEPSN